MSRFFAALCFIIASLILGYLSSPLPSLMKPRSERLYDVWKKDLEKLSQDEEFRKTFAKVATIQVHFTDPQVAEEFENFRTPFSQTPNQPLVLRISVTRWIDKDRYGFVVQHELFDQEENKIYEFGRTYRLGWIL